MKEALEKLFAQMYWADETVIEQIQSTSNAEALRLHAHVLAAELLWYHRICAATGRPVDFDLPQVWPEWSVPECVRAAATARRVYESFLAGMDDAALAGEFEYTNSRGDAYRNRIDDALLHVATHGFHHRGQIARAVREAGQPPAITDMITWFRVPGT
jgi:uncharacterized damage-inducible protein DinB